MNLRDRAAPWALGTAVAATLLAAILHTFVQASPTLDALMAADAPAEARQSLRMMWHGMSAIAWTYPVVLVLVWRARAVVARAALGFVAVLNGAQALLLIAAALWADGAAGLLSLPQWAPPAVAAVLIWTARPAKPAEAPARPRRSRPRLVLFWFTLVLVGAAAAYHLVVGTTESWPASLLASDTASPPKQVLYAMWLFSCVVFAAVPMTLLWSLRAPAPAGRFVVRYAAVLVACLMASWALTIALGHGPDMFPAGPVSLGLQAALTALSVPPRER